MNEKSETKKVIEVDILNGPPGGCGFRTGMWTATISDGRKFKFFSSIPHVDGMNEKRLIENAQDFLNKTKSIKIFIAL